MADLIRDSVERYYSGKFREHGPRARGADWNSEWSQELRFDQLLRLAGGEEPFSLIDYGCGYGALAGYVRGLGLPCEYRGFDLSHAMVEHARAAHPWATFVTREEELGPADLCVASGVFNVRLDVGRSAWREYVIETIHRMDALSRHGLAFNMLTSYSDPDRMRADLYYADPCELFDFCKRELGRDVALLHDYGLYEFTILVRKGGG
jgi:SAM-dependent methyltransferase